MKAQRLCQYESHPMSRKKQQTSGKLPGKAPRKPSGKSSGKLSSKLSGDNKHRSGHGRMQSSRPDGTRPDETKPPASRVEGSAGNRGGAGKPSGLIRCPEGSVLIWGRHAAEAVLANPERKISALYLTREAAEWFRNLTPGCALPEPRLVDRAMLIDALPRDEKPVHQGVVMVARMLEPPSLDEFLAAPLPDRPLVILLDQVTDCRNIGAIMRSARAFGAAGLITTDRHSPPESAAILRTASGAAEHIPLIRVVNLSRAMELLKDHGFMLAGMTARGDTPISALARHDRLGIIMGAEGKGLRRLTEERADIRVRIPIDDAAESLNVSAATAVALFAARG